MVFQGDQMLYFKLSILGKICYSTSRFQRHSDLDLRDD